MYNWKAIKKGDVNHSHRLSGSSERKKYEQIAIDILERKGETSGLMEIWFEIIKVVELEGLQKTISFDPSHLKFVGFESGKIKLTEGNFGMSQLSEGLLGLSWSAPKGIKTGEGTALFALKFEKAEKAEKVGRGVDLYIVERGLKPEVYIAGESNPLNPNFVSTKVESEGALISYIRPNPFNRSTAIGLNLTEASEVKFRLYNPSGMEILSKAGWYESGQYEISIYSEDLPNPGLYLYSLSTGVDREFGRLVHVK
ncbi:MAG: hypothetical protein EA409_03770 [Saprospirales bacterium]|nr:MAG: hypothetical protein EA409_03770 [Saprospirales bacterium]